MLNRPNQRRQRHPRGATLIELMVSLVLLAVILSVTVGLIVGAIQSGQRARARAALAREGEFLNALLSNELRMAGVGVPTSAGTHIDDAYAGSGITTFDTKVILAAATAVGVVGDFPRPYAQYNTLGWLDGRPGGDRSHVMWHTENNGACTPNTVGTSQCATGDFSNFFPGEDGCGVAANVGDRTCPWGMRRVSPGERIQVFSGAMRWTHAGVASPLAMTPFGAEGSLALNLSTTWAAVWPNDSNKSAPNAVSGQGYVATIDRVFYSFNAGAHTVSRIQCYGDPSPQDADWPSLGTNTLPSVGSLAGVTPATGTTNECVGPEVVAKDVQSVDFRYFDNTGAELTIGAANKANVQRIDWSIKMRRAVGGRNVEQDVFGAANIRN